VARLIESCTCTMRQAGQGRAEVLGFHRFVNNAKVVADEVIEPARRLLVGAVAGLHVLAIQDTSEVSFKDHARVTGLGPGAGGEGTKSLFVHPVLAVDADSGALLGLAAAALWTRAGEPLAPPASRPLEERESYRWIACGESAKEPLASARRITFVSDRESEFYEIWVRMPDERCHVLIRAQKDRKLASGQLLFAAAATWPGQGERLIELQPTPGRARRSARLELRFGPVELAQPRRGERTAPPSVRLHLVEVRESDPPQDAEPVHWRLLTTHAVQDAAMAWQVVDWYRQRWHVEQVFRTMKRQGFGLEESQVVTGPALIRLAALVLVAAVRIMQLVLAREGTSGRPATDVVPAGWLPLVAALVRRREGKTAAQKNPHPEGSLAWLSWVVARLGGWTGYASERKPGPITMANGWYRFEAIAEGWQLRSAQLV
jgi:Transposase DDE domain